MGDPTNMWVPMPSKVLLEPKPGTGPFTALVEAFNPDGTEPVTNPFTADSTLSTADRKSRHFTCDLDRIYSSLL